MSQVTRRSSAILLAFMLLVSAVPDLISADRSGHSPSTLGTTLPRTGQAECYNAAGAVIPCAGTGQDGEIQSGATWPAPRFEQHISGDCITDLLTGLMWQRSPSGSPMGWGPGAGGTNALAYAQSSTRCEYDDWRLPNVNEMRSLLNQGAANNAEWLVAQGFQNVTVAGGVLSQYWTSTSHIFGVQHDQAWTVDMRSGYMTPGTKIVNYVYLAWPVRGTTSGATAVPKTGQETCWDDRGASIACAGTGQDGDLRMGVAWPAPRFSGAGDCMTDALTGLTWAKAPQATTMTWTEAFTATKLMTICGRNDWRLPNRVEMLSLIGFTGESLAWLNDQGFTGVTNGAYWSSTTFASLTGRNIAWLDETYDYKTQKHAVWTVRGPDAPLDKKTYLPVLIR